MQCARVCDREGEGGREPGREREGGREGVEDIPWLTGGDRGLLSLLSLSSANVASESCDCRKGYYLNEKETRFFRASSRIEAGRIFECVPPCWIVKARSV